MNHLSRLFLQLEGPSQFLIYWSHLFRCWYHSILLLWPLVISSILCTGNALKELSTSLLFASAQMRGTLAIGSGVDVMDNSALHTNKGSPAWPFPGNDKNNKGADGGFRQNLAGFKNLTAGQYWRMWCVAWNKFFLPKSPSGGNIKDVTQKYIFCFLWKLQWDVELLAELLEIFSLDSELFVTISLEDVVSRDLWWERWILLCHWNSLQKI